MIGTCRPGDDEGRAMGHVSLVTLGVGDVEQATRYYEAAGWQRSSLPVDYTIGFLPGGTVVLGLFGRDDLAADAAVSATPRSGHRCESLRARRPVHAGVLRAARRPHPLSPSAVTA
jgi:hypothetical protein